jgi:hypothetical protein
MLFTDLTWTVLECHCANTIEAKIPLGGQVTMTTDVPGFGHGLRSLRINRYAHFAIFQHWWAICRRYSPVMHIFFAHLAEEWTLRTRKVQRSGTTTA